MTIGFKKISCLILISLGFIFSFSTVFAQPVGQDETMRLINQYLIPTLKKNKVQGAAIIVYDHGVPRTYYYGYASNKKGDRVTGDTIFEIGSITKVFTSVALASEVNSGLVSLSDPASAYLPQIKNNATLGHLTLQQLAAHVNGLGAMPGAKVTNRYQLMSSLGTWKPSYAAGTWWKYSNVGFGLLGYALESSSHQNYISLVKNTILNPLQMHETLLVGSSCQNMHCSEGHSWDGKPVKTTAKLLIIPAAGSIAASGKDMQRFMAASLHLPGTPEPVSNAISLTQKPFYQTSYGAQGLGWEIHHISNLRTDGYLKTKSQAVTLRSSPAHTTTTVDGRYGNNQLFYDKTGSVAGYRAYIAIVPSAQSGIVVMANRAMMRSQLVSSSRKVLLNLVQE